MRFIDDAARINHENWNKGGKFENHYGAQEVLHVNLDDFRRSVPELILGWIRQVRRRTCALLWLVGAVSDGVRVTTAGDDPRGEAAPGARARPPMVECVADSVRRQGGSSRG